MNSFNPFLRLPISELVKAVIGGLEYRAASVYQFALSLFAMHFLVNEEKPFSPKTEIYFKSKTGISYKISLSKEEKGFITYLSIQNGRKERPIHRFTLAEVNSLILYTGQNFYFQDTDLGVIDEIVVVISERLTEKNMFKESLLVKNFYLPLPSHFHSVVSQLAGS